MSAKTHPVIVSLTTLSTASGKEGYLFFWKSPSPLCAQRREGTTSGLA